MCVGGGGRRGILSSCHYAGRNCRLFQGPVDHGHHQARPRHLQHGVPGGAAGIAAGSAPHHTGGVLPLLLLSPWSLLRLLRWRRPRQPSDGQAAEEEQRREK